MSAVARPPITKVGALERQIEAAVFLILKGFPPEPIHTLIGACRGILDGLHKNTPNKFLAEWNEKILSRVVPGRERDWLFYQNRVANFLKHADRDPEGVIEGVNLVALNDIELQICILAYWEVKRPLHVRIAIGLFYCGLQNEKWFNFSGFLSDVGLDPNMLDKYRGQNLEDRNRLMLDAFEMSVANDRGWG
ncbi:hypothetical protein [Frigidibacter sp.]|uniref:hypothetical protein n=1 Tax=Frigidibacter sp. TaxID=2586418 RepID=UPI0027368324|nr:hypothetical protein [Frigidibacter sp.]MDP3340661.1 hypothetical protein [Frigidibacter sp.]